MQESFGGFVVFTIEFAHQRGFFVGNGNIHAVAAIACADFRNARPVRRARQFLCGFGKQRGVIGQIVIALVFNVGGENEEPVKIHRVFGRQRFYVRRSRRAADRHRLIIFAQNIDCALKHAVGKRVCRLRQNLIRFFLRLGRFFGTLLH